MPNESRARIALSSIVRVSHDVAHFGIRDTEALLIGEGFR